LSRLVKIPHIGLVNIVSNKGIVRELIQGDATAEKVSRELFELIENDSYRKQVKAGLNQVRENLGDENGASNMAQLVLTMLEK
jgi:lipid-A-disaccharide synthase